MRGVDYSWARPGGAAIRRAGFHFVCRYLSTNLTGKNISILEANDLHRAGLSIVLVWETIATRALAGFLAGVEDAKLARTQATKIGFPKDLPIYFAVDFDATLRQQKTINQYFRGVGSKLPVDLIGLYGSYYVCKRTLEQKLIKFMWQTTAWSSHLTLDGIHLKQLGKTTISNCIVDINESYQDDFGQWKPQG